MAVIENVNGLFSISPRMRFGKQWRFGRLMFGFSEFGDVNDFLARSFFGNIGFGVDRFADIFEYRGIFQSRPRATGKLTVLMDYYIPKNPQSIPQQANRTKFCDAIIAWRALSTAQKKTFNIKAAGKGMSGYNMFLRKYMLQ